ncbi:MAG: hypothetical protein Q8M92_07075, partial [Candidatus Subteraquimicrobiales bacterium]|nr:hypothetical protein [Candidatus Subteraquimicrobiales bacterium]
MAIKIVTGILGAGKTYFCVQELLAKYYTYSEEFLEWRSKGDLDVEIITNISGLKLPIRSLDSEILLA